MQQILTDEEVTAIAESVYPIIDDSTDGEYIRKDILYKERSAYEDGWKECTKHYSELIQKAERWDKLVLEVEHQSNLTNDPMVFHLSVGELTAEAIQNQ